MTRLAKVLIRFQSLGFGCAKKAIKLDVLIAEPDCRITKVQIAIIIVAEKGKSNVFHSQTVVLAGRGQTLTALKVVLYMEYNMNDKIIIKHTARSTQWVVYVMRGEKKLDFTKCGGRDQAIAWARFYCSQWKIKSFEEVITHTSEIKREEKQ